MQILRVFNNNVVLAKDDVDNEVILTGRGLGFQARPGFPVDESKVARTFVPVDNVNVDRLAEMAVELPPELISVVTDALIEIGLKDCTSTQPILVMALADRVQSKLRQSLDGNITNDYPLLAEVLNLYPQEYAQGLKLLKSLNKRLDNALPTTESLAFALYFVNSGFSIGNLSYTYKMTALIQQMISAVEKSYGTRFERSSVILGRFITHMRYMFVRIYQNKQLTDEPENIVAAIVSTYPEAEKRAEMLATLIESTFHTKLTHDELAYLTLHIARLAPDEISES